VDIRCQIDNPLENLFTVPLSVKNISAGPPDEQSTKRLTMPTYFGGVAVSKIGGPQQDSNATLPAITSVSVQENSDLCPNLLPLKVS
jgi:hypothetical protein